MVTVLHQQQFGREKAKKIKRVVQKAGTDLKRKGKRERGKSVALSTPNRQKHVAVINPILAKSLYLRKSDN